MYLKKHVDLKNSYNLTVGLMFHSEDSFRTSSPGDSILSNPAPEMGARRGARLWRRFAAKGDATRHPVLRKVALLHVGEDAGVWAHRGHPFRVHLRSGGPFPVFFASRAPVGSLEGEAAVSGPRAAGTRLLPECPPTHSGGPQSLLPGASLFTDMAGNIPFLNYNVATV